jgi:hypothetical protein
MVVLHRRDASFKVLHWPKLFEGQMWVINSSSGDGIGYGAGYGDDWGNSSFGSRRNGGSYRGMGDGFAGDGHGFGLGNGDGASR